MILNKTFRYSVSNWVVSNEKNLKPHLITQEEINSLLKIILSSIDIEDNKTITLNWIVQKNKNEHPEKIDENTIMELKLIALNEMKELIKIQTKNNIPREFIEDDLFFSKQHLCEHSF